MTRPTPANATPARICPNCDGFATVAISSGGRDARGHLNTIAVRCRACSGSGTVASPARLLIGGAA